MKCIIIAGDELATYAEILLPKNAKVLQTANTSATVLMDQYWHDVRATGKLVFVRTNGGKTIKDAMRSASALGGALTQQILRSFTEHPVVIALPESYKGKVVFVKAH